MTGAFYSVSTLLNQMIVKHYKVRFSRFSVLDWFVIKIPVTDLGHFLKIVLHFVTLLRAEMHDTENL